MSYKKKLMVIAVVALFCASAVACIFISNEDSSADDKRTYNVYFEAINDSGAIASSDWVKFTSEPTNQKFVENANAAFVKYGYSGIVFSYSSDFLGITYNGGFNNATFYGKNNGWQSIENTMTDYINNSTIGLVLGNGYISQAKYDLLTTAEQAKWQPSGMGAGWEYMRNLAADTKPTAPGDMTCHYFAEVIGADGKVVSSKWVEFTTMKTNSALVVNATAAFKAAGLDKITLTVGSYGVSVLYNGDMNNSCMYANGKEWKAVEDTSKDYLDHETIALSVSHGYISETVYKALNADGQKAWKDTGYGGDYAYQKIVSESTEGYKPASNSDNTVLIIGIVVAIIAVLIVVVVVWYFKFRK